MTLATRRFLEAKLIWEWIQWRLPADVWLEAQQVLAGNQPTVTDPVLSAGLTELLAAGTTRARKLQLLRQLLNIIKDPLNAETQPK